jgi:hypothetical protein
MPTLKQTLQMEDLGYLCIVADAWRIEVDLPDVRRGRANLATALLNKTLIEEMCAALPPEAARALSGLQNRAGRLPWARFTRQFGEVRDIGPARRDREHPHINPHSTTEWLYYRALIGRAFFAEGKEPLEFAFIPEDLAVLLPSFRAGGQAALGRPATPAERRLIRPANDHILNDACSLLAAIRLGLNEESIEVIAQAEGWQLPPAILVELLRAAGLIDLRDQLVPEATRLFLEAERPNALLQLVHAWRNSLMFNELRLLPGLTAEGTWTNEPLKARTAILDLLASVDLELWQSLNGWIEDIHRQHPDFQRSGADYEAWYLRSASSSSFLRGEANWLHVEGALLRFFIMQLLPALGLLDLGSSDKDNPPGGFKVSRWGRALLNDELPDGFPQEAGKLNASASLQVDVPREVPRAVRYQVARFCEWDRLRRSGYRYFITPASLEAAQAQGLKVEQLIILLGRSHNGPLPPGIPRTLERWAQLGTQARIESVTVLRVTHPEILEQLKASRASRFLGTPLGPTTITVQPGARHKVYAALAELGVLAQIDLASENDLAPN